MEIIMNDDGTISFREVSEKKKPIDLYSKIEVSNEVTKICNDLASERCETLFVFDRRINDHFNIVIENDSYFYEDETYFITNKVGFYPKTRMPLYETETKIIDIYNRYDYVYNWIVNHFDFQPSEWNLGREYEQNFTKGNISITLNTNMLITIKKYTDVEYHGYFSKSELYKYVDLKTARDLKVKKLLKEI